MRASRLLAILILLQLRGRVTAQTLAGEFEVSLRTIYRDIDALSAAGVPVYGDPGHGGGFALLDGYRTRLTGLDAGEAEAMLLIGLPDQARALGLGHAAKRARDKLMAALPGSGENKAARIADCFHLDTVDWYRSARPVPHLSAVARAVFDRAGLSMVYTSWTTTRDWIVDPLGIVLKAGNWYLVGRSAGKARTYNIADIQQCTVLDRSFDRPAEFNLATWWSESQRAFEAQLRPGRAILSASGTGRRRLARLGAYAAEAVARAEPPDARGWQIVTLPVEGVEETVPALLSLGLEIEILSPASLRSAVRAMALEIATRMEDPA